MLETDPSFRPVRVQDGYPALEDLGLIGDGATVALPLVIEEMFALPSCTSCATMGCRGHEPISVGTDRGGRRCAGGRTDPEPCHHRDLRHELPRVARPPVAAD